MLQLAQTPKWAEITLTHDGWKQEITLNGKVVYFSEIKEKLFKLDVELPAVPEDLELFAENLVLPKPDQVLGVHCGTYLLDKNLQERLEQLKYYLAEFPEELTPFVEISYEGSFADFLSLMAPLSTTPFQLIVHSSWIERFPYAFSVIGKGTPFEGAPSKRLEEAIIVPAKASAYFEAIASFVERHAHPIRIINECEFIYAWDGVERLYAIPESLSKVGERAIKGFEATGGEVYNVSK
jgi:hypothetical protein